MAREVEEVRVKLVLFGNAAVAKTSLLTVGIGDSSTFNYIPTGIIFVI